MEKNNPAPGQSVSWEYEEDGKTKTASGTVISVHELHYKVKLSTSYRIFSAGTIIRKPLNNKTNGSV